MKAYLYIRFSSAEQAKGDSVQRQRTMANEWLAKRPGIELDEELVFIDEGVSSFSGQNLLPGRELHRFLACVDDGRIPPGSILLVESLDRISRRQIIHAQRLLLDILLKDITVATTSPAESREYTGKSGLHDLIISLAGMERAHQESLHKSNRVREAWIRKRENVSVQKLTKKSPAWLTLSPDRKSFSVVEEKAAVVRMIFEWAENIGQQSIARLLNDKGIPPFQGGTKGWHSSSVVKILTSPAVIGTYQPHTIVHDEERRLRVAEGAAVEGYYPRIVDDELYYRVQALRGHRRNNDAGRKGEKFTNLFSGIAKCASCGGSMVIVDKGEPPKGGKYLVCSGARRGTGCVYRAVHYRHCEHGFLMYCRRVDVSELLPSGTRNKEAHELRKQHTAMLGEVERKRSLVARMLSTIERNGGDIPKAIHQQLLEHEKRIAQLVDGIADVGKKLKLMESEKKQLVGMTSMFTDLLVNMRRSSPAERYVLRAKLHGVLKASIGRVEIGAASPEDVTDIARLVREEAERFQVQRNPDRPPLKPRGEPVVGKLSRFRVLYKNGNLYDLFLDTKGVVAGRLTYAQDAAVLVSAKPGFDALAAQQLHLSIYDADVELAPKLRGADGKFRAANRG